MMNIMELMDVVNDDFLILNSTKVYMKNNETLFVTLGSS